MGTTERVRRQGEAAGTPSPVHLPRLLPAGSPAGPTGLPAHLDRYGGLRSVGSVRQRDALLEEVSRAGLTGRGGAAFPTARKLAAVAAGRRPVVVGNGTEGEPASAKDKVLLAQSPHLVLDGAAVAAELVGASRAIVVVHHSVREIVDDAAAERRRAGSDRIRIEIMTGADRFVGGEASALVHWIERGVPTPTRTPPRASERGLRGRPTLVQNVETLAHVALIARYGADWFRAVGTSREPGSMLVTVQGAVNRPRVDEITIGTPIHEVLSLADGASAPLQALLLGGYFGTWVPAAAADLPFSRAALAPLGASVGAGLVAALPDDVCGLVETARVVRFLADESAGQCGSCLFGLDAIAGELHRLADGSAADQGTLRRWLGQVEGRGACSLPDGAVRLVRSALTVFGSELEQHARGWCCATRTAGILPLPPRRP
ncbi:NADH-ubiquinone oxidoreductase-F iron-sulfur binding region domain-containing protein [Nocardioides panaciterrulae]|uniref:NADH:ubiquinone oxidoreductase subunit F (NADH-binding) n=1 Tax=Nocardioides panaciterrulae TaxID=661492 RepID=A0A7Y9E8A5_9ACTN|nr:NADH-ubiquinone oxidoreductase-F iron-sulfur binding region domain-containing protein [Nocardioides panaciterrulae]NYD42740.1 NADH:ubiquinone oxidoreductase subunit F (NADH-binding) [Nocardioides panaciterrulae]